jgi:hypothetical protein
MQFLSRPDKYYLQRKDLSILFHIRFAILENEIHNQRKRKCKSNRF